MSDRQTKSVKNRKNETKSDKKERTVSSTKQRKLWSIYENMTIETDNSENEKLRTELLKVKNELNVLKDNNTKLIKRTDELVATAQREIRNLIKSRDLLRIENDKLKQTLNQKTQKQKKEYLFEIYSNKYGFIKDKKEEDQKKLLERNVMQSRGVRWDTETNGSIRDFTEQDYFRLFFKRDHQSTQTTNQPKKEFKSRGSCTRDDSTFINSLSTQTESQTDNIASGLKEIPKFLEKKYNVPVMKSTTIDEISKNNTKESQIMCDDEFTTGKSAILDESSQSSIPFHSVFPSVVKTNMKTKVRFNERTFEFDEIVVPATPRNSAFNNSGDDYSQDSRDGSQDVNKIDGPLEDGEIADTNEKSNMDEIDKSITNISNGKMETSDVKIPVANFPEKQKDIVIDQKITNSENLNQFAPLVRTPSSSQDSLLQDSQELKLGLFSGPEFTDASQDSTNKFKENENVPNLLSRQIENKATIGRTKLTQNTPQKQGSKPEVTGSSKRKSQTPMKLTAEHNQAPKKKKRRKSSGQSKQKNIKPLVEKHSDNSPQSEDSRPATNPFVYTVKESEPHSPFSNSSSKSPKPSSSYELKIVDEEETRFSYSPPIPNLNEAKNVNQRHDTSYVLDATNNSTVFVPENANERIKLLGLEMTNDATMFNDFVAEASGQNKTSFGKTPPRKNPDWKALGLQMSETKMNHSSGSGHSTSPIPTIAKRNIFQTKTPRKASDTSLWAGSMLQLLETDRALGKLFDEQPAKFLSAMQHIDLDSITENVVRITSTLLLPSPEHVPHSEPSSPRSPSSSSSIYEYEFQDFSMPPIS